MIPAFAAVSLLAATLTGAATADSEQALIEEAWLLERDPILRPTHIETAVPGTFEDGMAPWGIALTESAAKFDKAARDDLDRYFDGKGPLPVAWKEEVERSKAMIDGALAATHGFGARLPPGGQPAAIFTKATPGSMEFQHLARLGLLDAVLAAEKQPGAALGRCADLLALARDLSHGYLVMALIAKAVVERPVRLCMVWSKRAPVPDRKRFAAQVRLIRKGWGTRSDVLRRERLYGQLRSGALSEDTQSALPPAVIAIVREGASSSTGFRRWLFGGSVRRAQHKRMTQLMSIVDQQPDRSDAEIERISAETPLVAHFAGLAGEFRTTSWLGLVRWMREAELLVAALEAVLQIDLFREANYAWPQDWRQVLPDGAPTDPRTGRRLVMDYNSTAPRVVAEPDKERSAPEVSFELGVPVE